MMTKDFEEYFPFPWNIFFYGDGVHYIETDSDRGFWIMEEKGDDSTKRPDSAEGRAAMKYIVRSANLMPEAVEVLNEADDHMGALLAAVCDDCPKLGTEDCEECPPYKTLRKIGVLLAKLEGGEIA